MKEKGVNKKKRDNVYGTQFRLLSSLFVFFFFDPWDIVRLLFALSMGDAGLFFCVYVDTLCFLM